MKKLEISSKHRVLIESIICQNPKLEGNEHLMDEFCEAIYKKSYLLIDTIKDAARLKKHLLAICDDCMTQIIVEKGNFDAINYKSDSENVIEENFDKQTEQDLSQEENITNTDESEILSENEIAETAKKSLNEPNRGIAGFKEEIQEKTEQEILQGLSDPLKDYPPKAVSKNAVEKLMFIIRELSDKYPSKKYYDIFSLRYIKKLGHVEIAHELQISQIELSRRYVEMIRLARESV